MEEVRETTDIFLWANQNDAKKNDLQIELFLFSKNYRNEWFFLMKQRKELYLFLGRTALYFLIFLGLLYFFSYLGQGQGSFIYNEF